MQSSFYPNNHSTIRIALFQPDIPQNMGTILRMAACFNLPVDIIEPCGFVFNDQRLKRSGMDYLDKVDLKRHADWSHFIDQKPTNNRLVLLTTRANHYFHDFKFQSSDILLFGRESAGVPEDVHQVVDERIIIPMHPDCRSLNVAISCALVVGEALRQLNGWSQLEHG